MRPTAGTPSYVYMFWRYRSRALAGALAVLLLLLPGCEGSRAPQNRPPAPSPSPSTSDAEPSTPEEAVYRLPERLGGAVVKLVGVPVKFPSSLAEMPDVEFGEATKGGVRLAYRPRETLDDGAGWSSETIALLQRRGGWARLWLGQLGIAPGLWPGADMMGAGALNATGDRLAFHASRGVVVIDLESGSFRHYLGDVGRVGGITWHPGGRRFTADPVLKPGPDVVVKVPSGSVAPAIVPVRRLGFLATGAEASVARHGQRDVVESLDNEGTSSVEASLAASPLMTGRGFRSWFSGQRAAYTNTETVRGRYALRVADLAAEQAVATLTWSRRTGMFLKVHGWWDSRRILLSMDRSLATWDPDTRTLVRVASLPQSDFRMAHGSVGISFPQTLG